MKGEAGFSLIEALVALALGAMVISAVLSTVRVAASGAQRARHATDEVEAFARAGVVLAGDAAHALPGVLGMALAVDLPMLPRPVDGLPQPPVVVEYRLQGDAQGVTLTRAEAPLVAGRPGAPGPAVTLWQGETAMTFRFLDAGGNWRQDWPQEGGSPRAFALSAAGASSPVLVAALPDLLPAACAFGPGPDCPLPAGDFP